MWSTLRQRPWLLVLSTVVALAAAVGAAAVTNAVTSERKVEQRLQLDTSNQDPAPVVDGDRTGNGAPAVAFTMIDGTTRTLAAYKGKPVVVNFFASSCEPCRREMPDLQQVHAQMGDKVVFLGIAVRDQAGDAKDFVNNNGATYDIGLDPSGSLFDDFGRPDMPSTFLIDADGRVVNAQPGAVTAAGLRDLIAQYLRVT